MPDNNETNSSLPEEYFQRILQNPESVEAQRFWRSYGVGSTVATDEQVGTLLAKGQDEETQA